MFCPVCSERLVERRGRLTCLRGRVEIPDAVRLGPLPAPLATAEVAPGASSATAELWFCPACATQAEERAGSVSCPRGCGSLDALLPALRALDRHSYAC